MYKVRIRHTKPVRYFEHSLLMLTSSDAKALSKHGLCYPRLVCWPEETIVTRDISAAAYIMLMLGSVFYLPPEWRDDINGMYRYHPAAAKEQWQWA